MKICLNMIVKNESAIIERCIASVKPIIHSWCIVDTGSTDDTKEKISHVLADLPGTLHERPWVDRAHNRTQALELAKEWGDALLLTDARFVWYLEKDFRLPDFQYDMYMGKIISRGTSWYLPFFIRSNKDWYYDSKAHAALYCRPPSSRARLDGFRVEAMEDGARRGGQASYDGKYHHDIEAFLERLKGDPNDTRAMYYLAQSYKDINKKDEAIFWYEKRVQAGGWVEEAWSAQYNVATLKELRRDAWEIVEKEYLTAYQMMPSRAEPLVRLSKHYRMSKKYAMANLYANAAKDTPYPKAANLFVEESVYQWCALDEYAISAYWIGKYKECKIACEILLNENRLPEREIPRVRANLTFAAKRC